MANIAWKVINGYGPYAYLQQSVRIGDKVISKHLQYLGGAGGGSMMRPGKSISYQGDPVFAPPFPEELLEKLKDGPKEKLLGATSTAPKSVQDRTDDAISSIADIPIEGVPPTKKGVSPRRPGATPAEIALVIEHPDVVAAKPQDRLDVAVALVEGVKSKKVTAKQIAAFAKHPKVTDAPAKDQLKVAKGLAERQALLDLSVAATQSKPVVTAAKKAAVGQLAGSLSAIAGNKVFSEKKAVVQGTIMQPAQNGTTWTLPDGTQVMKVKLGQFSTDGGISIKSSQSALATITTEDQLRKFVASAVTPLSNAQATLLASAQIAARKAMNGFDKGTIWTLPTGQQVEKVGLKSFSIDGATGVSATAVIQDLDDIDLSNFLLSGVQPTTGAFIDGLSEAAAVKNMHSAEIHTTWELPNGDKVVKVADGTFSVAGGAFVGPKAAMKSISTQAALTKFLGTETLIINVGPSTGVLTVEQRTDLEAQMNLAKGGQILHVPESGSNTLDFAGFWVKTDSKMPGSDVFWQKDSGFDTKITKSVTQIVNSLAVAKSFDEVKANVADLTTTKEPPGPTARQFPSGPTAKQKLDLEDQMNLVMPGSVLVIPKTSPFSKFAGSWKKVSPSATGPFGSKWTQVEGLMDASSQEFINSTPVITNFDAVKANVDALAKPSTGALAFGDVDKMTTEQALSFALKHDSIKHVFGPLGPLASKLSGAKTEDEFNEVWKGYITTTNLAIDNAHTGAAAALGFKDVDTWKSLISKASTAVYFNELEKAKSSGGFATTTPEKQKLMSLTEVQNIQGPAALAVAKQSGPLTANLLDLLKNDLDISGTGLAKAGTIGQIKASLATKFQAWGDTTSTTIIAGGDSQAASAGFLDADARLKLTMIAGAELFTQALAENGLLTQSDADLEGAATVKPVTAPKITNIPKLANGKPAIGAINVKKLEAAAAKGTEALEIAEDQILEKLLAKSKKAAISNAVVDLVGQLKGETPTQEGSGDSGQAEILENVATGKQKLPTQSTPSKAAQKAQEKSLIADNKDWDADLEKIAGQKGSNEGGLYKDKKVGVLYYVKWSGDSRARIESLASDLYGMAGVQIADTRVIKMAGKTAIASEWIPDVEPLTLDDMSKRADVRENFVVDAWLANWDVVGLQADNIVVSKDGATAYRIDPGGSLIFRAQGKIKTLSPFVPELSSMREPGTAPQGSQVFAGLTDKELKVGAAKVAAISEQDIDEAVDRAGLPQQIPEEQFDPNGISAFLKSRLKERRTKIINDVLNFSPPKPLTAKDLKKVANLDNTALELIIAKKGQLVPNGDDSVKALVHDGIIKNQLGDTQGKKSVEALRAAWATWKGSTTNAPSSVMRWAGAEVRGRGDDEIKSLERFWKFSGNEVANKAAFAKYKSDHGNDMLAAMAISDKMNTALVTAQKNPIGLTKTGKKKKQVKTTTVYRTWQADQVTHLGWNTAKVGDKLLFDEPTFFSWSLASNIFTPTYHGQIRVKATIPIDQIQVTDRLNPGGGLNHEDESLFCCPVTEMTVIKAP